MRAIALFAGCLLAAASVSADTVTLTSVKDNTLYYQPEGQFSSGAADGMFVGKIASGEQRRGLLAFDLTGIPPGSTITAATLTLTVTRSHGGIDSISLYRATSSWGEGASGGAGATGGGFSAAPGDATWIHRFYDTTLWTAPGGDYLTAPSATSTGSTWSGAGMIADVHAWVDNPGSNLGWLIRGLETTSGNAKRYATREYATVSARPRLVVTFTPPVDAGACCFALGTCTLSTPTLCTSQGGTFSGVGTTCNPNSCPQPQGACCLPGLICQIMTQAQCTTATGVWQGNFTTCTPGLCQIPTGACCLNDASCQILRADQCATLNGIYRGDNVQCSSGLCPLILVPFVDALPIPPLAAPTIGFPGGAATYTITAREVTQRLHRDLPLTRVWGYNGSYPGPTIEAFRTQQVNVTWINDLRDSTGALRQHHYFPVDMCLHGPMTEGDAPRIVTHLHGAHCEAAFDGYPETTILPGESSYQYRYPNNQLPATLWYHDHALGITRQNVYMGLAGFYLLRDSFENSLGLPNGPNEIALAIQDRSFNPDGSLKYTAMWDEHFFGDFILVNGKVNPFLNVNRGKYRFRALNGSGSRTLTLALSDGASFQQIGTDGGLLGAPVTLTSLTIMPGERADLIMDFSNYAPGTQITLTNSAPAPFPGDPGVGVIPNVMQFRVQAAAGFTGSIPTTLRPMTPYDPALAAENRDFTLQNFAATCTGNRWMINGLDWDTITEFPHLDTTEVWNFINRSSVSHPMHIHLVEFQILDRQDFQIVDGVVVPIGPRVAPAANEAGWKDVVQCPPSQITRVIMKFTEFSGKFSYHCHILEHEDNEMMRQFQSSCYSNCDGSTSTPTLTANDFQCFLNAFAAGKNYANCDQSTASPLLTANDFQCFLIKYAQGCQ